MLCALNIVSLLFVPLLIPLSCVAICVIFLLFASAIEGARVLFIGAGSACWDKDFDGELTIDDETVTWRSQGEQFK